MDWTQAIDAYCERTGPEYWSEPLNAFSNFAFIVAAVLIWRRIPAEGGGLARLLAAELFAIGVGSWLFHTHATAWASIADVGAIAVFVVTYLYAINRSAWGMPRGLAAVATLGIVPYAWAMGTAFAQYPFLRISGLYWTLPLLLVVYAALLRGGQRALSVGMLIGAAILSLSITLRSLDMMVCDALPIGTHFLWHTLNGLMLGYMILIYLRHLEHEHRARTGGVASARAAR